MHGIWMFEGADGRSQNQRIGKRAECAGAGSAAEEPAARRRIVDLECNGAGDTERVARFCAGHTKRGTVAACCTASIAAGSWNGSGATARGTAELRAARSGAPAAGAGAAQPRDLR